MKRIVVVGGGVIGTACAQALADRGAAVTVLDKGQAGRGCSHGNCGYVCPSHVLPLAGPGMIGKTLKLFLQKDSPLAIRARVDLALWMWLVQFARRCNRADMMEAGRAIQALLDSSRALYGEMFRSGRLEAEWEEKGLLFVFQTPREMEHYAETDRLLFESFNRPARRYDGAALTELEPALKPGLAGGWHYEGDAHLRPDRLMSSWRRLAETLGVELREGCSFKGFRRQGRLVRAVETANGPIEADVVVIATGAWTPLLNRHLGCRVPIQPGKGYSVTMPRPAICPRLPMMFEEHRVAVTPWASGYRLGSTMEFAGYDTSLNRRRIELLIKGARHYLSEPTAAPVQEEWWGWRPMVYDGKPIIGRSPAFDNVWLATGHGMLGISMATGTAQLIAELIEGQRPHIDPAPYLPTRF